MLRHRIYSVIPQGKGRKLRVFVGSSRIYNKQDRHSKMGGIGFSLISAGTAGVAARRHETPLPLVRRLRLGMRDMAGVLLPLLPLHLPQGVLQSWREGLHALRHRVRVSRHVDDLQQHPKPVSRTEELVLPPTGLERKTLPASSL